MLVASTDAATHKIISKSCALVRMFCRRIFRNDAGWGGLPASYLLFIIICIDLFRRDRSLVTRSVDVRVLILSLYYSSLLLFPPLPQNVVLREELGGTGNVLTRARWRDYWKFSAYLIYIRSFDGKMASRELIVPLPVPHSRMCHCPLPPVRYRYRYFQCRCQVPDLPVPLLYRYACKLFPSLPALSGRLNVAVNRIYYLLTAGKTLPINLSSPPRC
jgi:hypothetical protein